MDIKASQMDLLVGFLNSSALRHRVIAQNVANVNTPNYKRLQVSFDQELAHAVKRGESVQGIVPKIVEDLSGAERVDGNNVDIDQEMNELGKNSLLYSAAAQILSNRISLLRSAITR